MLDRPPYNNLPLHRTKDSYLPCIAMAHSQQVILLGGPTILYTWYYWMGPCICHWWYPLVTYKWLKCQYKWLTCQYTLIHINTCQYTSIWVFNTSIHVNTHQYWSLTHQYMSWTRQYTIYKIDKSMQHMSFVIRHSSTTSHTSFRYQWGCLTTCRDVSHQPLTIPLNVIYLTSLWYCQSAPHLCLT
jgi:hypothetical protein